MVVGKIIENILESVVIDIVIVLIVNLFVDLEVKDIEEFFVYGLKDFIVVEENFEDEFLLVVNECIEVIKGYVL